ncbi:MAG: V-type ATP synthase subunit A [Deltaproteobacteria bacterium]|nr:V-type ATP synthase subunit A [Deltaproteobacteria bacterium]
MRDHEQIGKVIGVNSDLVTVEMAEPVMQNEMAYIVSGEYRLKSEVIKIQGSLVEVQVYEDTRGIRVGDKVIFTGELLSAELGPGLLGQVFDGLQNPLPKVAERFGFFIPRGTSLDALDRKRKWGFVPSAREGDTLSAGHFLGHVQEGVFTHYILVPFHLRGQYRVRTIADEGDYAVEDTVAQIETREGVSLDLTLMFHWPIKIPIRAYRERLRPSDTLITGIRIIDTFFPIAKGGTYCIPGPFGAGKTVLQHITARHAEIDLVIIAACGERAGEIVEVLREFPKIEDPRTGRSLMERTVIICNTSSMPVAARESSVYTAITIAEYYRQMGLDVLLLADSTSRWAQAMREISGRLEEIPGEEAYPAYLESRIASFYERAGAVVLSNGKTGSVTIGGTVSPAGGTFEEPVTQGTLKVVGAFHGLSRRRANARRFPSIDPHESWSNYPGIISPERLRTAREFLSKGREVEQMMKVVGEEGTSLDDYIDYLKAELLDHVYLQQNAFDRIDGVTSKERQDHVFGFLIHILSSSFTFPDKDVALRFFQSLRQLFIDWNYCEWDSRGFRETEAQLRDFLEGAKGDEKGLHPNT